MYPYYTRVFDVCRCGMDICLFPSEDAVFVYFLLRWEALFHVYQEQEGWGQTVRILTAMVMPLLKS